MTTQIGASVFVDPSEITHSVQSGSGVLTFGPYPTVRRVDLFFDGTAGIDAVIAGLVALKQEMDPPVPVPPAEVQLAEFAEIIGGRNPYEQPAPVTDGEPWTRAGVAAAIAPAPSVPNPPYHMTPGTIGPCCLAEDGGYICNAQDGHDGPQHVAYGSDGGECHRWPVVPAPSGMQDPAPVARVITDSERTCPESNPGSGAPCYRSGDHGVHRDPDGEEWRTDGAQEHGYVTPAMAERRDKAAAEYEARQQAASVTA